MIIQIYKHIFLLLLTFFGTVGICFAQSPQDFNLLQFKAKSEVLYEHYANNISELERISTLIDKHTTDILANKGYFQLIAYIPYEMRNDPKTLNEFAIRASVVRGWIRTQSNALAKMDCAFFFSTSTSSNVGIEVNYIASPLIATIPQAIHYSKDKNNIKVIKSTIDKYGMLPFLPTKDDTSVIRQGNNTNIISAQVSADDIKIAPDFVIYFRVNKSDIDPNYMNNSVVLNQMNLIVNNQNIAYIDSIVISAYASPEAPSLYNKKLSERRARTVKEYFMKQFSMLKPEAIHAYGRGENWGDLRRMAEEDEQLPMKEEVLSIINSNLSEDEREKKLKALNNSTVYRYIYRNYYPKLRLGASLNVMLAETAPEGLRSLINGSAIKQLPHRIDTLSIFRVSNPTIEINPIDYMISTKETKYIRPIAVKTNLLFDVATLFNIELEAPLGKRFSILAEWTFPFWGGLGNSGGVAPLPSYSEKYTLQMLSGGIEGRYWFPRSKGLDKKSQQWGDYNPLNGWFIGLYGGAGIYDFQWNGKGMQGEFYIASGISAGYAHPIGKYFHMEYSLGLGYIATEYYNYTARDGHKVVDIRPDGNYDRRKQSFFGPTKLKVSLIWIPRFKVNKK